MSVSSWAAKLTGAGLLAVALLGVACSGGGGGGAAIDPANGDQLAHQAMLSGSDLPGSGWDVTQTDQFDDSSSSQSADTPACKDIDAKQQAAKAKSDAGRTGRAEIALSREGNSPVPTSVDVQIDVFKDSSTPADVLKQYQDALKSSNFETCLKDTLNASINDPSVKVSAKSSSASTAAPQGGVALAYDFTITGGGQTVTVRYETYAWRYSNTRITVTVGGDTQELTPDVAKAALTKTQGNLQALAKK